jgi:transcriptional regulator GlxA family with amidase domain
MSRYSAGVNDINPPLSAMTRHLLFFVFADFQLLDVSGPMAAFEMANRIAPGSYRWTVCSQTGGQVTASCGVALDSQPLAASTRVDTLLAPGGDGVERACDCVATRVSAMRP